ncbi:MAG: alpha/beta fold hydrolase [Burkholderiales bacterium]|nr:alpha/beta fold hydrolase [Burkholderiales bacterium]
MTDTKPRPTPSTDSAAQQVEITCADGVRLHGHFLRATGGVPGLPVLLCPATGVKQHFYLRFATWLAAQGHDVLVFDYRGIGLSLQGRLRDSKATLQEWGQLDQVAALDWLLRRSGSEQVLLLGHSAGGQMMGLMPNHPRIARLVGVSASTGWFRGMRMGFRVKAHLGLRCIVPLGTLIMGYGPCAAVGLGENLPSGVARQWGQWCAAGGYATNATRSQPEQDFHADVRTPITVLHASDDDIATPATVADLLRTFPAAPKQALRIKPADYRLKQIGHIDWFRTSHQALWPLVAAALRDTASTPS